MVNAQEWLDKNYPKEKRAEFSKLDTKSAKLEGKMVIQNWPNLEVIICKNNELTEIEIIDLPMLNLFLVECCQLANIKVKNCPVIRDFDVKENWLTDLSFLEDLSPERLVWLNVQGNNFPEQDLSFVSKFTNLERLMIKNRYDEDKFKKGIYNHFSGSLEPLKGLKKLKWLNISNTDIDSGLEYLPDSVRKINCWDDWKQAGCARIRRELERASRVEGVTEKLQKEEEGDPDQVRFSDRYYRLAPWHQVQDLLLEKKPLVQKLREQLMNEQTRHSKLQEKLKENEKFISELQEKLNLAIKEEEIKKNQEKDNRIKELEEQVKILMARDNNLTISPVFTNTASFNNQVYYIQYNQELSNQELTELKQKYKSLETTSELSSDPQKLKKTILFLGAKQIFATTRQDTINGLIETYENVDKSGKKYEMVTTVGEYMDATGDIIGSFPLAGIPLKLLGQGIPAITNLLKDRSFTGHAKKFEDYLVKDEKALFLLQKTYHSLIDSQNTNKGKISPILINLLKFKQDFSQHSVFEISKLPKGGELTSEKMNQAIESLINHLKEFTEKLQEEVNQYTEKLEEVFASEDSENLQEEVTELLKRLSGKNEEITSNNLIQQQNLQREISAKRIYLDKLIDSAKDKLKSNSIIPISKQERIEKLESIFKNFPSVPEKLVKELENIKRGLSEKLTEQEINEICQAKIELENLQEQQSQIQIPPK